jgi:hypothetical protein
VEVIGDGVIIDFADRSFLGADRAGEITEMVDGERDVGGHRLADRLAIVPCLGERNLLQIGFHPVGDLQEDLRAVGYGGAPPRLFGGVRRVESRFDVRRVGAGDLADRLAGNRRDVIKIFAGFGRPPFAADIVLVPLGERGFEGDVEINFGHALLPLSDTACRAALTARFRPRAPR